MRAQEASEPLIAAGRAILVGLIALAVATAPVAAALLGGTQPVAMVAAQHDCHRMASQHEPGGMNEMDTADHDHAAAVQDSNSDGCPDCGSKNHVKCIDGGKCCKLTGMIAGLPDVTIPAETADYAANPPRLIGWQLRPPRPPPRA